jgi:transposase
VNLVRGTVKGFGERLAKCDADRLGVEHGQALPEPLRETLKPVLEQIESLTERIRQYDVKLEQIARTKYPETELLRQVGGVGILIALTFVLTLEDAARLVGDDHSRTGQERC